MSLRVRCVCRQDFPCRDGKDEHFFSTFPASTVGLGQCEIQWKRWKQSRYKQPKYISFTDWLSSTLKEPKEPSGHPIRMPPGCLRGRMSQGRRGSRWRDRTLHHIWPENASGSHGRSGKALVGRGGLQRAVNLCGLE